MLQSESTNPLGHQHLDVDDATLFDIKALEVAKKFILSEMVEERLKWVRSPEIIRERLDDYPAEVLTRPPLKMVKFGTGVDPDFETVIFGVLVERGGSRRFITMVATEDGPRVDWDAFARYCTESWEDIFAAKVEKAKVRVNVKLSDNFTGDYQDHDKWGCFELYSDDFDQPLHGYCERSSKDFSGIETACQAGQEQFYLEVEIDPHQITKGQIAIATMIKDRWEEKVVSPND
ncbi:hypothetical protein N9Z95_02565 [Akkermansiaceae bacterium]|nr:hypothetical protein [Akkermansiaceae bacterium]